MHGPDGVDHRNENIFREIEPDRRIVIEHIVQPHFVLTVTLTPRGEKTHLSWVGELDDAESAAKIRAFAVPGIEQVLDRLQALLAQERG